VEGYVIRWSRVVVVLGSILLPGVSPALAQAVPEPDSAMVLEPMLVRVLRSTIGTEAPYPVSVVSGAELTRGSASAFLEDALRAVPGVQIHNRFNFAVGERLAVRGFGPRSQFGVRGIRVLVDGIPATLPDGQATIDHLDLANLGRVEALRGPNAAL
jgi:iron complex outermembrane recepter protein